MIKLKYDVKCGFNQIYIVEKDCEMDITFLVGTWDEGNIPFAKTEKEFYEKYKDRHDLKVINEFGIWDLLAEDIPYYGHTYFEDICKRQNCLPGLFKVSNIDIIYDETQKGETQDDILADTVFMPIPEFEDDTISTGVKSLRASEVMALLDISRNTLSRYVKKGLLEVDKDYKGKQYRYSTSSVYQIYKLKESQNKKRFSKKDEEILRRYYPSCK